MYKLESFQENESHRILWDFEIQTDHQILVKRLMDHQIKLKISKKRDKYLDLARAEKAVEHEGDGATNCNWYSWNGSQRPRKEIGVTGDQKRNQNLETGEDLLLLRLQLKLV